MTPIVAIAKKAVGGLSMYFLKKYAAELVYDWTVDTLDKLAQKTATHIDDDVVRKLKEDREEALRIIRGASA